MLVWEGPTLDSFTHEWRRLVPSVATVMTLLLGLGAIEAARFGDTTLGVSLILLAILSDGIDGVLARRWGVVSNFGGHLDALADLVTFGVAPGILFAAKHSEAPGPVRVAIIAMIAMAGAWRLARFQAEPPQKDFVGMPITAGGPLFAVAVAGFAPADLIGSIAWGFVIAFLMASRVPFPRFSRGRLGILAIILALVFVVTLAIDRTIGEQSKMAVTAAQFALVAYMGCALIRGLSLNASGGRAAAGRGGRGE